jgi:hypothetical protein
LLAGFDKIWIDCMNGDSRETGKLTPDGKPDPSVFSTERSREGIRVGTAIGLMIKRGTTDPAAASVRFRQFWGTEKRAALLASLADAAIPPRYEDAAPVAINRLSFRPDFVGTEYSKWPRVTDLCAIPPINGLMEKRGGALFDIDRDALNSRMRRYFDQDVPWGTLVAEQHPLTSPAAGYAPEITRQKGLAAGGFFAERTRRYALRPFDTRWCYYSGVPSLWNRARPALFAQATIGAAFFVTRPAGVTNPEGVPVHFTRLLGDNDFQRGHSYYFPIMVRSAFAGQHQERANLSGTTRAYLSALGIEECDSPDIAPLVWLHAMAVGCSPAYLTANADGLRQDWPRMPLPAKLDLLLASAELGRRIAVLLDVDASVPGVTVGAIEPAYRELGGIHRIDSKALDLDSGDLDVSVGWGHSGKAGAVMPGRGRITDHGDTLDIWLNDRVYWRNVPRVVWGFTMGGYQVIKKWLSYREKALLGRALTPEEARYVTEMVRRIAALVAMQPELDANYEAVCSNTVEFPVFK